MEKPGSLLTSLAVLILLMTLTNATSAQPVQQTISQIDEMVAEGVLSSSCKGLQCDAAQDLKAAYDAMESRDTPNIMARLGGNAFYDHDLIGCNRVLNNLPRKHPKRIALYCSWLTRIAAQDPDIFNVYFRNTRWVIELAARLDGRDGHCIAGVMNALPRTENMDKLIAYEREDCFLNYPHHHCAAITRSPTIP